MRLIKTARGLTRQLEVKELEIENRIRKEEPEALAEALILSLYLILSTTERIRVSQTATDLQANELANLQKRN